MYESNESSRYLAPLLEVSLHVTLECCLKHKLPVSVTPLFFCWLYLAFILGQNTVKKNLTRLLPTRSLHLSVVNVYHSGVRELSGPTKSATEAACHPVLEGCNGGKVGLI